MNSGGRASAAAPEKSGGRPYDVERVRADFPILASTVHGRPLVYLDNAATTQKPRAVIDAVSAYYERDNANIHRGVHALSERATKAFEDAREKVREFLGASEAREIVFTRGTTEALNLVAWSHARERLEPGDEIVLTTMEHHSNIVPWQLLAAATGAMLRVAPITDAGEVDLAAYEKLLGPRTKIVTIGYVSNALGTVNPVRRMAVMARASGATVVVDGAQAVPHLRVDVREIGCDFFAFSSHKVYGPTGIGALFGREALLEAMPPWQGGGDMIKTVTFEKTTYNDVPHKFEAGTPDIAGAIGLGAAIDYVRTLGIDRVEAHERSLLEHATALLGEIPEVRLVGTAREKAGVLSFTVKDIHPHDVGTVLDREGIAIRTGHHCAFPVMERYGVPATARASFGLYNTKEETESLARAIRKALALFA